MGNKKNNQFKKVTQEDVELETLKKFLKNNTLEFNEALISAEKLEPTDIRYNNVNYQITEGDGKLKRNMRRETSKGHRYVLLNKVSHDFIEIQIKNTLKKKSIRADKNTVLLIDVFRDGYLDPEDLKKQVSDCKKKYNKECKVWKKVYLVFSDKNIKL